MNPRATPFICVLAMSIAFAAHEALADGKLFRPVEYTGSLEEKSQEAIIIFHPGDAEKSAFEDLILKITVEGDVKNFAWVVPLPNEPKTAREDAALFAELHRYVQARLATHSRPRSDDAGVKAAPAAAPNKGVEVLSRQVVGSYDVAVVRENAAGALNEWLKENKYQPVENADDVLKFYREKKYVYACVKVADAELKKGAGVDLHPLRFSFKTGGRDGIFFPMRLTGLQSERFDVNLYVFYDKWINDRISRFGFVHRGFTLRWRDYDSPQCKANAGKAWSDPQNDPYLKAYAGAIPTVTKLFQKMYPGDTFYLTNLYATNLNPRDVRDWADDLWLFPHYTGSNIVPFDAWGDGPASAAYKR